MTDAKELPADAFGRRMDVALKEEMFKVVDGLQTLAWLVAELPEDEARRTLEPQRPAMIRASSR